MSISQNILSNIDIRKHHVDPKFVANKLDPVSDERSQSIVEFSYFPSAKSESSSCSWIWNETNPDSPLSIASLFPVNNSDTETNGRSESNETPPRFSHYSDSIVSFFPPARSQTDSPENYETIIPNPSITIPSSSSHFFPLPNAPTSLFIPFIFPPTMSETETDDSCSESIRTLPAAAQFSYSIVSSFPPARSPTDGSSSENYEIILTDPSISARPRHTIRRATLKDLFELHKPKSSNGSKANRTPPKFCHSKKHSILSFFSVAKSQTGRSKRPRRTILTTRFKDFMEIKNWKEFPLQMLRKATNNFSEDHKIETSNFGSLYRATLDDGREVAIKCEDNPQAFLSELEALSRLHHKNLVCLVGFCEDSNEHILVYEHMKNGSLHNHLHELQSTPLMSSWAARIQVVLDAARGIEYLHVYAVPPIIHHDIKSSNILLDNTWSAKVFAFSQTVKAPADEESHLFVPMGNLGYLDPEYAWDLQLTTKSDVYSFGVILLEILSGYKALHKNENGEPRLIVDFLVPYIVQGEIHKVLDSKVRPPTPFERNAVAHVGSLAVACVSIKRQDRPSMTEIVKSLQRALHACVDPKDFN